MINFVNILELNYWIYNTNGTVIERHCKGKFLFTMNYFVSFGTYLLLILFMSDIFLKNDIDGICVTKFQLSYIRDTTNPLHKF